MRTAVHTIPRRGFQVLDTSTSWISCTPGQEEDTFSGSTSRRNTYVYTPLFYQGPDG